jgi:hypothetical protein
MAQTPESPIFKLYKFLPLLEKINLAAVFIGIVLQRLNIPGSSMCFLVGLVGLSITFFLMAYVPAEAPRDDEQQGFPELMAYSIVPKVIYISMSVSVMGILFYLLNIEGSKNMLLIGFTGGAVAAAIIGFFLLTLKHSGQLTAILFRALPVLLVTAYFLFQ